MGEHQEPNKSGSTKANLNTLLVSISLAVMLWMGNSTYNNSVKLAELSGTLMSRQEFEAKMAFEQTEVKRLDLKIQEVVLEIAKLRVSKP